MSLKKLNEESYNKESILCGILWNNPDLYSTYTEHKLSAKTLGNKVWGFYIGLGRHLSKKGLTVFDDISVYEAIRELNQTERFEKYGGYDLIEELMEETQGKEANFESYYDDVKKYTLLRAYYKLFGQQVLEKKDGYDYKALSRNQISLYWNAQLNDIDSEHNETVIKDYNLLEGLDSFINDIDENPDVGIPFYKSKKFTENYNGWANGTVSRYGAFSGNGKTSFTVEKLLMSCIIEQEKLAIIANEMDISQYRKLLLVTIMGNELYEKFKKTFKQIPFSRKNINKGNFTDEEKAKLTMATKWVSDKIGDNKSLIKFVPLEDYTIDNVEKVIRKLNMRGWSRFIIDTAKPSTSSDNTQRWEQFVIDFDKLYQLARKDGGGLDLAVWTTVQLADTHVGRYWLSEQALADSKKIKNVADGLFMMRPCFKSEYEGQEKEIYIERYIPKSEDMFNQDEVHVEEVEGGKDYLKQIIKLESNKVYYMVFTIKNRRGQTVTTGLDPIVYEVNFNSNSWKELGYAKNVYNDSLVAK